MLANLFFCINLLKKHLLLILKNYFITYRPFLAFLAKFILTYSILSFAYGHYLSQFNQAQYEVDDFTILVSKQAGFLIKIFDPDVATVKNPFETNMQLFYHQKYVARIVEGCNAMSVIVLFVSSR